MAPLAERLSAGLLVGVMGLLAGCRPVPPPVLSPTPSLPPPRMEHSTAVPTPTLAPTPSPSPLPTDLAGLAQAAFGSRLITQIHIPALNLLAPVTPVGWEPTAEAAAWEMDKMGLTLYEWLQELYVKYGFYREGLVSWSARARRAPS